MYIYSRPWGLQIGLGIREEWEEDQKKRAKNNSPHFRRDSPEIQVPNQCQICNENLKNPVMTLCSHFFCEKCALGHYSKSANCFQCQKPTNGTFNGGGQTIKKLQEAKLNQQKAHALKKTGKKAAPKIKEQEALELPEDLDEGEKEKMLEGVEFEESELKGLAGEFLRKRAKQKGKIKYESDWLM